MQKRLNDTYILLKQIGSGGGGVVYKAYHERLKTYVVVKKIRRRVRGKLEDRTEVDILKNMKHTYLPRVYDFLEIDGDIYTVIDFVPGKSLDKVLDDGGPLSRKRVLKWAMQLTEALCYLHAQNPPIIHSDIKPANIMLTPDDNICLIDFNISLALDHSLIDSAGISRGYSPPEQYRSVRQYLEQTGARTGTHGSDAHTSGRLLPEVPEEGDSETPDFFRLFGSGIDERSDIYSLGATLYHLLTGVRPGLDYAGIVPVDRCGTQISDGFAAIIRKMMEPDPDKRYQSAEELLEAFRGIREMDREWIRWKRSGRFLKVLAACLFAAGVIMILTGTMMISGETTGRYSRLIASAQEAMDSGEYDEAQTLLGEAKGIDPDGMDAYQLEIMLLYESGEYENCISAAEDLLMDVSNNMNGNSISAWAGTYHILGNACLETGDFEHALYYHAYAVGLNCENSEYFRDYAISLALTQHTDKSVEILQMAVMLGLEQDSTDLVLGVIAYANQSYEEAVGILLQAIEESTTDPVRQHAVKLCDEVYQELGSDFLDDEILMLEQERNRYTDLSSAAWIVERLADACMRKSESILEAGQSGAVYAAAAYKQIALDQLLELYNSGYVTEELLENIAVLYGELGNYEEAKVMLSAMLVLYPDSYVPYKRLALLEVMIQQEREESERDYTEAAAYYEKALQLFDDSITDSDMQELEEMASEWSE